MAWTKEKVLYQLETSDKSACFALVQLYARQTAAEQQGEHTGEINGMGFSRNDAPFLSSLALQVIWRQRDKELGKLPADAPLLSVKQLQCARAALVRYAGQLVEIANARKPELAENIKIPDRRLPQWEAQRPAPKPVCATCGQPAQSAYITDEGKKDYCGYCLYDEIDRRMEQPYALNEEEKDRLQEELELMEARRGNGPKIETGALVIQGRDIRFKTAKELSHTRTGMPTEMEENLWRPTHRQMTDGAGINTAPYAVDEWDEETDDPFNG